MDNLNRRFIAFEPNAIVRGAQLTFVGAHRALQNPNLFTSEHYKQVALAVVAGIVIRVVVAVPTIGIRLLIRFCGLFTDLSAVSWDEDVIEGIAFVEHSVLQIPFFLMSFMRFLSPAMDNMFMASLAWVDQTYMQKHASENPESLRAMYAPNLRLYNTARGSQAQQRKGGETKRSPKEAMGKFLMKFGKKAGLSLGVYLLSFLPYVGRFVLPAASFWTFNKAVGWEPAVVIFGAGVLFLPKRYLVMFLQSYFSSRSLMRELLEPYFSRLSYSPAQKKTWFHDRAGVLYGFALSFFILLKIPLLGVLIYGIAEASTAYLITKITEPPPQPALEEEFKRTDVRWVNKHEFLALPLEGLDRVNVEENKKKRENGNGLGLGVGAGEEGRRRQFS